MYVGLLHRDYHLPLHLQLSSEDLGQGPPAVFSYITKLFMVMVVMEVVVMMVVMMMVVTMMVVVMMVMVKMMMIIYICIFRVWLEACTGVRALPS